MKDYSNGKIYCIRSHQTDDIYIGSTIQPLSRRFGNHKKTYKYWMDGKSNFMTSFEILKYNDCYIELLEKYPCNDKSELERREGKYIREMDCVNKHIAGRTKKEYYQNNKEKIQEQHKEYYQNNKEKIQEQHKEWCQNNKDKMQEYKKEYYQNNKEKIEQQKKEKYQKNKDKIQQQMKEWYQKNKDKFNQKVTCECDSIVSKNALSRHKKSIKHQCLLNK